MKLTSTKSLVSLLIPFASIAVLSLTGCDTKSSNYDFNQANTTVGDPALPHGPIFDPANSKIPATNDLLFKDSKDGTLNIPNDADKDGKPDNSIIAQINQLDGFSTTNPITIDFGMSIDPASLKIGETVRVFEVVKGSPLISSVVRELSSDELVALQTPDKKLAIVPKRPLKGNTSYLVILEKGIKDKEGKPSSPPSTYFLAKGDTALVGDYAGLNQSPTFIGLSALISNNEEMAFQFDPNLKKDDIIMSWSFTTQSINDVLKEVANNAAGGAIVMVPTGKTSHDIKDTLPGYANISIGTLEVPYYLETPSIDNPTGPLTGTWKGAGGSALTRYNKTPILNSTLTIPVIMTTPNAGAEIKDPSGNVVAVVPDKPADGWKIAIYQHGITRMRTDILAYADSMAAAGFAVIAIDLPLHGIPKLLADGSENGFHASNTKSDLLIHPSFDKDVEPSFDVDYVNNKTNAPGQDGIADESGTHFMNLASLLTSRDNIRQAVSNLLVLRRSLENIDINADGTPDINTDKVGLISHSLGGVVAVPYLAVEEKETPSSLIAAGASITKILTVIAEDMKAGNEDANPFGKQVKNGLAAKGIKDEKYQAFMYAAQFVLESADPVNYAQEVVEVKDPVTGDKSPHHPVHLIKITGDKVVRNDTTDVLAMLMGATTVSKTTNIEKGKAGLVTFTEGNHSSVLDPTRGGNFLNVFTEIHKQLGAFQATSGSTIVVSDEKIIK